MRIVKMAEEKVKKRSANFSLTEINLLMNCLLPEIHIIENKKTDGVTLKEKQEAWKKVHTLFAAQNKEALRDLLSLKLKYDNIKRNLKKKISDNKAEGKKTGGGPPEEKKLLWYEEQLFALLQLSIVGLEPQGDCDGPALTLSRPVLVDTFKNPTDVENIVDLQISGIYNLHRIGIVIYILF